MLMVYSTFQMVQNTEAKCEVSLINLLVMIIKSVKKERERNRWRCDGIRVHPLYAEIDIL